MDIKNNILTGDLVKITESEKIGIVNGFKSYKECFVDIGNGFNLVVNISELEFVK